MNTIEQKVIAIIKQELKLDVDPEITDELVKFEADSLDRAEIIFSLEDEFKIELHVPDKATAQAIFTTVQSICDWVTQEIEKQKT
jgi:acyl carrier protein